MAVLCFTNVHFVQNWCAVWTETRLRCKNSDTSHCAFFGSVHSPFIRLLRISSFAEHWTVALWQFLCYWQAYVVAWPLPQCHYSASRETRPTKLAGSACTLLMTHSWQSVHRAPRWWFSGATYWYCSTTANSRGGRSCCSHLISISVLSPRTYSALLD